MIKNIPIPLKKIIGSEPTDFVIRSKRNYPLKKALGNLIFSLVWNGFTSVLVFVFIVPTLRELSAEDFHNEDFFDIIFNFMPMIVIGIFVFAGIFIFVNAIIKILQKGSYFAITETRFIKFRKGKIMVTNWTQFSGNIEIRCNGNSGDIDFELKTGKMRSRENAPDMFVPDFIYVSGIDNVFEVEKQCRFRIEQHNS